MFLRLVGILTIISYLNEDVVEVFGLVSSSRLISSQSRWIKSIATTRELPSFLNYHYENEVDVRVYMALSAAGESRSEARSPRLTNNNNSKKRPNKISGSSNMELGQAKAINKELITAITAQDVLEIFISKGGAKGSAGGNVFNSVNFSTCLHRLARFANQHDHHNMHKQKKGAHHQSADIQQSNKSNTVDEKRRIILSDPRFGILIAALSEAILEDESNKALIFNNRELANLGWAIAKLKLAPPSNVYPIVRPMSLVHQVNINNDILNNTEIICSTIEDMHHDMLSTATKVRAQILEVAKERSYLKTAAERASVKNRWIPTLSQLSGKLLDMIATRVLLMLQDFNSQELANLLYAFASAGRADMLLFEALSEQLVKNMQDKSKICSKDKKQRPKPQEFSNSVWAFASVGLRCDGQVKLIEGVADILDHENGAIVEDFKPQELSNTAWGVATLIAKRGSEQSPSYKAEDQAALRILRWVAKSLKERVDDFKPQESELQFE